MDLGIDLGGSAIKLAALEGERIVFTRYIPNGAETAEEAVSRQLRLLGTAPQTVSVTGVGAAVFDFAKLGLKIPVVRCLEAESISAGATLLTGLNEHLTVSIGTGTAFVLTRNGCSRHLGGSALGGGALLGLSRKILGEDIDGLSQLCSGGDLSRVDLQMGELPSCPPTLDPSLTAANLVKTGPDTTDADWAIGILNMVIMSIGSMAYLTASGAGISTVVFTGGITRLPAAKKTLEPFSRAYAMDFLVPEFSDCATAAGAAILGRAKKE